MRFQLAPLLLLVGTCARKLLLLSTFPCDDKGQWGLIPHFVSHYRDRLGIPTEDFHILTHSQSKNERTQLRMAKWLHAEFGIKNTYPLFDMKDQLKVHLQILYVHSFAEDWILVADSDEFVMLPLGVKSAWEMMETVDLTGLNVIYSVMVDRVHESGALDGPITAETDLFAEYPLTCMLQLRLLGGDPRKASFFRGYLRADRSHHSILGVHANEVSEQEHLGNPNSTRRLLKLVEERRGREVLRLLPPNYFKSFPIVRPASAVLTLYHFKYLGGATSKAKRPFYIPSIYNKLLKYLDNGGMLPEQEMAQWCLPCCELQGTPTGLSTIALLSSACESCQQVPAPISHRRLYEFLTLRACPLKEHAGVGDQTLLLHAVLSQISRYDYSL